MNLIPIYSRCVFQILNECKLHSFSSMNGGFKNLWSTKLITSGVPFRVLSLSSTSLAKKTTSEERVQAILAKDPSKDRRIPIPVETSIRYMRSKAYTECYGSDPVWKHYRRNYGNHMIPKKTRRTCVRAGVIATGNPCPICRDEYLIVHHTNIDLLKQFISSTSGELIRPNITGICKSQFDKIIIAYLKAKDLGLITYDVPFRSYDYSEYSKLF